VAQYTVGDKRRYIYGTTRKDVAVRLNKAIAERDSGIVYDSENLKVADYLGRWLDSIRDTLRERTWRRHEEISRLHLKPTLGSVRQDKMNAFEVQSLYRSKLDSGLSPRTVQIIRTRLYKALKQAVRWALVPRNVCEEVVPTRVPKSEIKPLDTRQAKKLLVTTRDTQPYFYPLYVLAVTTGMRSGDLGSAMARRKARRGCFAGEAHGVQRRCQRTQDLTEQSGYQVAQDGRGGAQKAS